MRRTVLLILALVMTLGLIACGGAGNKVNKGNYGGYGNSDESRDPETERPVVTTSPEETGPFESIVIEEEGSVELWYGHKRMTFTMPTEISHYYRLSQTDRNILVMTHDSSGTRVKGRTVIELSSREITDAMTGVYGGYEGSLSKRYDESLNPMGNEAITLEYWYDLDLGDGYTLTVRIEAYHQKAYECEFDDNTIDVLLSHCEFH